MRATWRSCAVGCKTPRSFGFGNPVPRDDCERGSRPIRHAASAGPAWRRRFTRDFRGRSRRDSPARNCWISPPLKQALADTLAQEEQSLLFSSARLCASNGLPRLRSPSRVPAMHGLVGRASIRRSLGVSPLRLHRSQAQCLPRMRCGGSNGGLWARCRTPGRRDRHAVPGSAGRVDDERHNLGPTAAAEIVRRVQATRSIF